MKQPHLIAYVGLSLYVSSGVSLTQNCEESTAEGLALQTQYKEQYKNADFKNNRYTSKTSRPEQIHIAYSGQSDEGYPTGMNVAWAYERECNCVVKYGQQPSSLDLTSSPALVERYIHDGSYHYNVDLKNLQPNTRFYYTVICDDKDSKVSSAVFSFLTAKNTKKLDKPYRINVFGDMGWLGSAQRPVILPVGGLKRHWTAVPTRNVQEKFFEEKKTDMMWIVGDIGYADDAFDSDVVGGLYERCYDGFMNWMQNISANVPFHVSVGNHESECHSAECVVDVPYGRKLSNFSAYNTRFHMPSAPSGGVLNMWYSWRVGPVHFISLNTETDFPGAGEEKHGDSGLFPAGSFGREGEYLNWLENDLKKAFSDKKAGKISFIIAGGHRPSFHPTNLDRLFQQYELDLFIAGHEHTYARSLKTCSPPACHPAKVTNHTTTFVFCGGAGNDETGIIKTGPDANASAINFATAELSTGWLTIFNESVLGWQLVSSFDERVIDKFYLKAKYA